jgi:hypothetical protein
MLNEFRCRAGVTGFRTINDHFVVMLLKHLRAEQKSVAVIDATDLPAATADKKKRGENGRPSARPWERVHSSRVTPVFTLAIKSIRCDYG